MENWLFLSIGMDLSLVREGAGFAWLPRELLQRDVRSIKCIFSCEGNVILVVALGWSIFTWCDNLVISILLLVSVNVIIDIKDTHVSDWAVCLTGSTDSPSTACIGRASSTSASWASPVIFKACHRHVHKVWLGALAAQDIGQNLLLIHFRIGAYITGEEWLIFDGDDHTVSVISGSRTKPLAADRCVARCTAARVESEVRPGAGIPVVKRLSVDRSVIQLAFALHVNHLPRQKPEAEIDTCNEEVQNDSDLLEVFPSTAARALFLPVVVLEIVIIVTERLFIGICILIRLHDDICVVPADTLPELFCLFFSDARPPL